MGYYGVSESEYEKTKRPLPRRGQVKAKIFSILIQSITPKSSKNGEKSRENSGTITPVTPQSGYSSEG
ncbi:hypothetical protein FCM35_KLT03098 [Carex littledalei]|uniref:Uncharacterized protein n=1 Tax=Carex littledalei TaxID=544730 RepID=A0A833VB12_9POAL|nr:hypothetical protein FCM35_KLT03098 [Carex littledalei]